MRHSTRNTVAPTPRPDKIATRHYIGAWCLPSWWWRMMLACGRRSAARWNGRGSLFGGSRDGRAAWSFLESTTRLPDLVISDLAMPHVTGPELLRRIEARYPGLPCAWMSVLARDVAVAAHPELANY